MLGKINLEDIKNIAKLAGDAIMGIYNQDFTIEYKDDTSPLTQADLQANKIICTKLLKLYPNIPIMSEENDLVVYKIRKHWEYYWCIDPLDGTKEFIKQNGEFTVNIALMENNIPVLGVVYAPVSQELYSAKKNAGAFKNNIKLPIKRDDNNFIILASRSHLSEDTKTYIENIETTKKKITINKGSSLKLCMIAEGVADIYPRLSPTMEWDTAAADAIVRESGKYSYQLNSTKLLEYNKKNLLNPYFEIKGN